MEATDTFTKARTGLLALAAAMCLALAVQQIPAGAIGWYANALPGAISSSSDAFAGLTL